MTPTQLRKLLEKAGLSQRGAAKMLEIDERTMRYYAAGTYPIPRSIEIALTCLAEHRQPEEP